MPEYAVLFGDGDIARPMLAVTLSNPVPAYIHRPPTPAQERQAMWDYYFRYGKLPRPLVAEYAAVGAHRGPVTRSLLLR